MMNGKKTYMVALATILGAGSAFLSGQLAAPDAIQMAITAILGATIRHGISTTANPGS